MSQENMSGRIPRTPDFPVEEHPTTTTEMSRGFCWNSHNWKALAQWSTGLLPRKRDSRPALHQPPADGARYPSLVSITNEQSPGGSVQQAGSIGSQSSGVLTEDLTAMSQKNVSGRIWRTSDLPVEEHPFYQHTPIARRIRVPESTFTTTTTKTTSGLCYNVKARAQWSARLHPRKCDNRPLPYKPPAGGARFPTETASGLRCAEHNQGVLAQRFSTPPTIVTRLCTLEIVQMSRNLPEFMVGIANCVFAYMRKPDSELRPWTTDRSDFNALELFAETFPECWCLPSAEANYIVYHALWDAFIGNIAPNEHAWLIQQGHLPKSVTVDQLRTSHQQMEQDLPVWFPSLMRKTLEGVRDRLALQARNLKGARIMLLKIGQVNKRACMKQAVK